MWQLISRACRSGCTAKRKKRGQTDQINKAQMRRSHGNESGFAAIWFPVAPCKMNPVPSACQPNALLHIMMNLFSKYTTSQERTSSAAVLQRVSGNTTWYHSDASYVCECFPSNKRASSARHVMPPPLLQCIRRKAHKDNVSHVTSAAAAAAVWLTGGLLLLLLQVNQIKTNTDFVQEMKPLNVKCNTIKQRSLKWMDMY